MLKRSASVSRKTRETEIEIKLTIDGKGNSSIQTGVGFFDHMLESFTKHGFFDLEIKVSGDTYVDSHHTVEDTGIVLGQAFKEALGDKAGIKRYGHFVLPMDEALVLCALDISGRSYTNYELQLPMEILGTFETETAKEFFIAFASSLGMNLHLKQLDGSNTHHILEAAFKALAKSLDIATQFDDRIEGVLSTKGTL